MAKKKKTVTQRISAVEDREGILYGYIDDLRISTKRADKRFAEFLTENEKRIAENEERIRVSEERMSKIEDTKSLLGRLLLRMNEMLEDHERRLPAAA